MSTERLRKEEQWLKQRDYQVINKSHEQWLLVRQGPKTSPFEGVPIYLQITLDKFPVKAPKVRILNHMHHPSVDTQGQFCPCHLEILEKWAPTRKISKLLEDMWAQLAVPQRQCGLNPFAQKSMQQSYDLWAQQARDTALRPYN